MSRERKELGKYAEDETAVFLKGKGYKILERNYTTQLGEIDLIAKKGASTVFIEVKSRSSPLFGSPYLRITEKKKKTILKTALLYLKAHGLVNKEARIDVVAVSFDKPRDKKFELIENAFGLKEGWLK